MPENKTVTETVDDAIHSKDKPLGKQAPGAPFAIVSLTYIAILAISMIIFGLAMWLFR